MCKLTKDKIFGADDIKVMPIRKEDCFVLLDDVYKAVEGLKTSLDKKLARGTKYFQRAKILKEIDEFFEVEK